MGDTIRVKRGQKTNLPTLNLGEPAFTTDEGELYIGTSAGNVKVSSKAEVIELGLQVEAKANQTDLEAANRQLAEKANQADVAAALNQKRDKSVPLEQADLSSTLQQQIAGTAGLLSIPQDRSVGITKITSDLASAFRSSAYSATISLNSTQLISSVSNSMDGLCSIECNGITGGTGSITLKINGKNLCNGQYDLGYIQSGTLEPLTNAGSSSYRTTKWIAVTPGMQLVISGNGINRNMWQFKDSGGTTYQISNAAAVIVPAGMAFARCYYANYISSPPTGALVQVEQNSMPTDFEAYRENVITIQSGLNSGDKIYQDKNFNWYSLIGGVLNSVSNTNLACSYPNMTITVSGTNIGNIVVTYPIKPPQGSGIQKYGVRWTGDSSTCERLGDAIGLVSGASIGTNAVQNSFDSIYPWSGMKLCNIKQNSFGANVITYYGDSAFKFDGSNGDVFVEIPKFYISRYQQGGYEYLYICDSPVGGFVIEPAFIEGNKILDKIYVGVYDGYVTGSKLRSYTGTYPTTNINLSDLRTAARANGTGYSEIDIRTLLALQHLYLVEFANRDSQTTVGSGITGLVYSNNCYSILTESNVNRITVSNSYGNKFYVGHTVAVSTTRGTVYEIQNRIVTDVQVYDGTHKTIYFNGSPVNVTTDTQIYHTPQPNGSCDAMTAPSGRPTGDTDKVAVRYRYIENLWGNIWNFLDGMNVNNLMPYLCYDITKYASQVYSGDYKPIGYTLPLQDQLSSPGAADEPNLFIKGLGYDPLNPAISLPYTLGNGATKTTDFADTYYCYNTPVEAVWGAAWDHYYRSGLFCMRLWLTPGTTNWLYGGRLIYKPI